MRCGPKVDTKIPVASHLFARGYESFLPLYKCRRRWSDRSKEIELPLFPGYVFCQFNSLDRFPILSIPGCRSLWLESADA